MLDEESDEEDEDDEDDLPRAGVACSAARSLLTVNIGHMVTSVDWSQQWDHTTVVQPYTGPVPTAAPCQCSCHTLYSAYVMVICMHHTNFDTHLEFCL